MRRSSLALAFVILAGLTAHAADWQPVPRPLVTQWGKEVTPDNAWRDYPRPQLVREKWESLNGLWDYSIVDRPAGESGPRTGDTPVPTVWDGKILVPFCVESSLSGVGRGVTKNQLLWYRRSLTVPEAWQGKRVMLRFDAVDWQATAWLNGHRLGDHAGGSDPFAFDLTDHLRPGENELLLRVWDPTEAGAQPRGKQQLKPEKIWYTAVTGIWQSVWLEPVPESRIEGVYPVADLARVRNSERIGFAIQIEARNFGEPYPWIKDLGVGLTREHLDLVAEFDEASAQVADINTLATAVGFAAVGQQRNPHAHAPPGAENAGAGELDMCPPYKSPDGGAKRVVTHECRGS